MGKRLNYIANFYRYIDECDPTDKQKNEIINKYNKIMSVDETYLQQINKFVKDVKFQAIYDITDIDEELDDILEELDDNNNLEEYNQLPDEDIEVIEEEKEELPDEDIEVIEEEKEELPDEDIEVIEEEKEELPDEDIEVIEEEKE
ncbi:MAG: hypothetical protein IJ105_05390, partial [Bacilli bacterium]|nr:hypothetical protein [Bacilli bacterium]